jgi:hypothetical protein
LKCFANEFKFGSGRDMFCNIFIKGVHSRKNMNLYSRRVFFKTL